MITALKNYARVLAVGFLAIAFMGSAPTVVSAQEAASSQTAWRLLDYLAVDYSGAVQNGQVISPSEYAEMNEFAGQVRERIAALPTHPAQPALIAKARTLEAAITAKQDPKVVAGQAHALAAELLAAYPTPLAPIRMPDLTRGAKLYAENCSSCHGVAGGGDGPLAADLDPPVIAFADVERARQRSAFGLYQVINQGLDGTAMASFSHLPTDEQWDLAFYVGRFAFSEEQAAEGENLWTVDATIRARFPDLKALSQMTPAALADIVGEAKADALTAYLRRHPEAVGQQSSGSLDIARRKLRESLAAYEAGDKRKATDLALAAYLDGFEPVEPMLTARNKALMLRIETAMGQVRGAISRNAPVSEVRAEIEQLDGLFVDAARALEPDEASNTSSFLGAFAVLLREGLEALLIVVAKGVAALQEAGLISLHPLALPRIDWLGFYPTIEGVFAQLFVVMALAIGFFLARPKARV